MSGLSSLVRARWRSILGVALGASAGAAYAHFIGCHTGACLITSNVWTAGGFGAVLGGLVTSGKKRPRIRRRGGERSEAGMAGTGALADLDRSG